MTRSKARWGWPEALVLGLIAGAYCLVWPVGEYAINDDWAYAKSLQHLTNDGRLEILDWNPMSLVGHVAWGWLFTALFGYSFTVTKLSVVALAAIESVVLLRLLRLCGVAAGFAAVATAAVFLNPLFFVHVFSFQTDIPAVAWEVVASFCFVKALGEPPHPRLGWLFTGGLAAAEAYLIRQSAVVIPAAVAVYVVAWDRRRWRWTASVAAFSPPAVAIAGFQFWYRHSHGETLAFQEASRHVLQFVRDPPLSDLPEIGLSFCVYVGLFVLPLAPLLASAVRPIVNGWRDLAWIGMIWGIVNAFAFSVMNRRVFPYIWNVLTPYGSYQPNELFVGDREVLWSQPAAWIIATSSLVAACCLARQLLSPANSGPSRQALEDVGHALPNNLILSASSSPMEPDPGSATDCYRDAARRLLTVLLVLHLGYFTATAPLLFDRHILALAPNCAALCCLTLPRTNNRGRKPQVWLCMACLIPCAIYSVVTTHDIHRLSQAGFQAANDLVRNGTDPLAVNGGYAFDGWHTYELATAKLTPGIGGGKWWTWNIWDAAHEQPSRFAGWADKGGRGWWYGRTRPETAPKYVVATSPALSDQRSGRRFVELSGGDYQRWWPWRREKVYVYEIRSDAP